MDLRSLLNVAYMAIVANMSDEDRTRFDADLEGPALPEVDQRGRPILRRPSRPTPAPPALAEFMAGGGG